MNVTLRMVTPDKNECPYIKELSNENFDMSKCKGCESLVYENGILTCKQKERNSVDL